MSKIFPVIHHYSQELTLEQATIAHQHQVDGIFLISHRGEDNILPSLAQDIKEKYPELQIGLNFLSTHITQAVQITHDAGLDMVWGDYCGISSQGIDATGEELIKWKLSHPEMTILASVAFKYQKVDGNPSLAAYLAQQAGFLPTTSGAATGSAPSVEKIQAMSERVNGQLAVASGMTPENVQSFAPLLSHILVSTGVSKDDYRFDEDKLARFIAQVRA
jgi:predicted TIM-barrel enzyme